MPALARDVGLLPRQLASNKVVVVAASVIGLQTVCNSTNSNFVNNYLKVHAIKNYGITDRAVVTLVVMVTELHRRWEVVIIALSVQRWIY